MRLAQRIQAAAACGSRNQSQWTQTRAGSRAVGVPAGQGPLQTG